MKEELKYKAHNTGDLLILFSQDEIRLLALTIYSESRLPEDFFYIF